MKISHLFKCHFSNQSDEFVDYELIDSGTNGLKRYWILSYEIASGKWFGYLQRSKTEESAFDHCDVVLPRRFVEALKEIVKQGENNHANAA